MINLAWWQILLGVIVGLIILTLLVVVHELGHAITARRNKVKVEEFGIGFPPFLKKLGTVRGVPVTLNWLPIGGFCRLKGEHDTANGKESYGSVSLWAKSKILLAGVTWNMFAAMVLFAILAVIGIPKISNMQSALPFDNHGQKGIVKIAEVVEGSPAHIANLQKGDQLLSVAGQPVELSGEVSKLTKANAGRDIDIKIQRGDHEYTTRAKLGEQPTDHTGGQAFLGIITEQAASPTIRATWSAPLVGIISALQFFWITICGLFDLLVNLFSGIIGLIIGIPNAAGELHAAGAGVAGPVGILGQIFPSALAGGIAMLIYISAIISVSLAVMNLLPIPGLDGGRLYLTLWYHARKKKLTEEIEQRIVGRGMMFIFGLILVITILDIARYWVK